MESYIVKVFAGLFQAVVILLFCGLTASVLTHLQVRAFSSKRVGLVNMLQVNQQLVRSTN
jgi:multisubunit Na+/H+ antiporter MnhG subunit